jgi:hypothetical protein
MLPSKKAGIEFMMKTAAGPVCASASANDAKTNVR